MVWKLLVGLRENLFCILRGENWEFFLKTLHYFAIITKQTRANIANFETAILEFGIELFFYRLYLK